MVLESQSSLAARVKSLEAVVASQADTIQRLVMEASQQLQRVAETADQPTLPDSPNAQASHCCQASGDCCGCRQAASTTALVCGMN